MAEVCAQSFQVCGLRVNRLNTAGVPITGANNAYFGKAPIEVTLKPNYQKGVELTMENGCGTLCGYYKQPDLLKDYEIKFDLCDLDNELIEILTGNATVVTGSNTIGGQFKRQSACASPAQNGVSLEFWTKRWAACSAGSDGILYWHWAFPKVILWPGEQMMKNEFMKIPIEGFMLENANWVQPFAAQPVLTYGTPYPAAPLVALGAVWMDSVLPASACGVQPALA